MRGAENSLVDSSKLLLGPGFPPRAGPIAFMTVPVAVAVHLRCHKSTSRTWLRVSRINDAVRNTFPLLVGHFRQAGREHCSARNVANCRNIGQFNYAWLFRSSTLRLDIRLPC